MSTLLKIGCYHNTFWGVWLDVPVWHSKGVKKDTPWGVWRAPFVSKLIFNQIIPF